MGDFTLCTKKLEFSGVTLNYKKYSYTYNFRFYHLNYDLMRLFDAEIVSHSLEIDYWLTGVQIQKRQTAEKKTFRAVIVQKYIHVIFKMKIFFVYNHVLAKTPLFSKFLFKPHWVNTLWKHLWFQLYVFCSISPPALHVWSRSFEIFINFCSKTAQGLEVGFRILSWHFAVLLW